MIPGPLHLVRISCCFETTRHLAQTKGRSLDKIKGLPLKVWMRGFIAHSKHFTYMVELVRTPSPGLFMLAFIQIKSMINKKITSRILTN